MVAVITRAIICHYMKIGKSQSQLSQQNTLDIFDNKGYREWGGGSVLLIAVY